MSVGGYQYINGITTGVQTTNGNGVGLNITASGAGIRLNGGQITGIARGSVGSASTDAINGSQLYSVSSSLASALGGGSAVNADGTVSAPSYTVGGAAVTGVGGAITSLDGRVTQNKSDITGNANEITNLKNNVNNGTVGLVQQASTGADLTVGKATDGVAVNFADKDGNTRTLKNVTAGVADHDAVNMTQLNATNGRLSTAEGSIDTLNTNVDALDSRVTTNATNIAGNTDEITNLKNNVNSGTVGLVQQAAAGADLTVGKATNGVAVDFADKDGNTRTLKNVTAGVADYDAVNMSQLNATNGRLGTAETKIAGNTNEITNISNKLDNGTVGLVQQDATTHAITVAGDKAGTSVNFAGTDGDRVLSGVAAGKAETDAVNVGQLQKAGLVDAGGNTLDAVTYDAGSNRGTVTFNQGGAAVLLQNVGAGMANTDAANVGQLRDVASSLGGGATIDANGKMVAPSYTVNNATYGSVADALNGLAGTMDSAKNRITQVEKVTSTSQANAHVATSGDATQAAVASGDNAVAIGAGATASALNSVAIGAGSTTGNRENTVSVGSAGNERAIANVADAVMDTDAVNKRQLDSVADSAKAYTDQRMDQVQSDIASVKRDSNAAAASAMAVATLPQSIIPGRGMASAALSNMGGESALAIGVSKVSENSRWVTKVAGTVNTRGNAGVSAGIGFHW
ncbi:YadA-like family protein [Variovorax sp. J31P207]|uniref:YadA family autotransporter adhesin n=1 Tax=Variovorax sp. J31P207 TaxID=3053510 RepID=UPI002575DDB8|nr:YadA-like family protein [Variovorax sp. J31P207]MDM0065990.1 YadA-like family protein [Variovorax sp. J31P207]